MGPTPGVVTKPRQVATATTLLWSSIGLGLAVTILDIDHFTKLAPMAFFLVVELGIVGSLAFLVLNISLGRNWARITFLLISLLGAVPYPVLLAALFRRSAILGVANVLQLGMQIVALILMFTGPGAAWFRRSSRV